MQLPLEDENFFNTYLMTTFMEAIFNNSEGSLKLQ